MKNVFLYLSLSLMALSMTACKLTFAGVYAGDGIYGSHDSFGNHSSWDDDDDNSSSCCSSNDREDREEDAYERQRPNDTSDLHPPGVKPRDGFQIMSMEQRPTSEFHSTDARVIQVANKYRISDYAATYIVRAIELAKANDESGITDLGLEKSDFAKFIKGKQISDEKLETLSAKLLLTPERAEKLLSDIQNDIKQAHE